MRALPSLTLELFCFRLAEEIRDVEGGGRVDPGPLVFKHIRLMRLYHVRYVLGYER